MWNESLKLALGRAANEAIFTCVEFGNSNEWIKLLNEDNFRPSNWKSPLTKLFEQFVKQRRYFLLGQCQKNQWDCAFFNIDGNLKNCYSSRSLLLQAACSKNSDRLRIRSPGAIYGYSEKGCRKNVHATIPKGNMGCNQYTLFLSL